MSVFETPSGPTAAFFFFLETAFLQIAGVIGGKEISLWQRSGQEFQDGFPSISLDVVMLLPSWGPFWFEGRQDGWDVTH